ncbi:MAG: DUF2461 domain-containing protein [Planctomycetota bacterium]
MAKNPKFDGFDPALLKFLKQLSRNNNRDWFQKNKSRYEDDVLFPALAFVEAFGPRLKKISPFFKAVPKRVGGSVMRIYRDTRFGKDKTPYKTNVGIHFRHEQGKDVHCPGFYLHLAPKECFLGAGIWHPDSDALRKIREQIDEESAAWKKARDNRKFKSHFELTGDSLKRPPRGFDPEHAYIVDLKRKDFIGVKNISPEDISKPKFIESVAESFASAKPLMRFLCESLRVPF